MANQPEVIVSRAFDNTLSHYFDFYDIGWVKQQGPRVPPAIRDGFDHLCVSWRDASNTHRMPLMITRLLAAFANTTVSNKTHARVAVPFIQKYITGRLDKSFTSSQKARLKAVVKDLERDVRLAESQVQVTLTPEDFWNEFCQKPEFPLSVMGSQNLAYCGQVFAYEKFLQHDCYRALGGNIDPKRKDKFWPDFVARFPAKSRWRFWDDRPVRVAREVRNQFAHHGGKATADLIQEPEKPFISPEGVLVIQAIDNQRLAALLREKVTELIDLFVERSNTPPTGH